MYTLTPSPCPSPAAGAARHALRAPPPPAAAGPGLSLHEEAGGSDDGYPELVAAIGSLPPLPLAPEWHRVHQLRGARAAVTRALGGGMEAIAACVARIAPMRDQCAPPPPLQASLESRLRRVVPTVQSLPARPPGDTNRGPGLGHPPALSGGRIARKRRRRHGPAVRDRSALPRLRSAMSRFSA